MCYIQIGNDVSWSNSENKKKAEGIKVKLYKAEKGK